VRIPAAEEADFLEQYLLPLSESIPVRGNAVSWEELREQPEPRLYLSEREGDLLVELRFGYGVAEMPYEKHLPRSSTRRKPGTTELLRVHRQPEAEQEAWQQLSSGFGLKRGNAAHEFLLRKSLAPIDFLLREVPRLAAAGFTVFGEEALTLARVNRNKPSIAFNVSSGIDWFDVVAVVQFGDQLLSLKELKRAIRRRERYVKLADGSLGEIPEEWADRYRHLFAFSEDHGENMRLSSHHLALLDQVLAEADRASTDAAFIERRERLRNFERIEPQPLPGGFTGELRPYQKAGFDWFHFLNSYGFGGCLADDMGMGKTIQALAYLQSIYEREPAAAATLIVMPRSLLFNWQREAAQFTPNLRVYIHADQGRVSEPEGFAEYNLVLTTYGVMLRDIALLRQYRFRVVILDEAQAVKNPLAETSRAARLLQGEQRITLTGTPIENTTLELWSQFAFLNPGLLGSLDYFREEFVTPIERHQDDTSAEFLRKMVFPFILRRTKDQVALDLPPRTEELLLVEMEPAQRKLYIKTRDYYRSLLLGLIDDDGLDDARMQILEGLLRLRQICNHPRLVDGKFRGASAKFELLLETLDTLRAEGHKALVFSQFVQMLSIIREGLDARGVPYAYLDGSTRDREGEVDRFQSSPELSFFLISLKAGGVGLNLTAADYVIHVDPWWNPAVEMQATDRTHRIGQTRPVFVYKLITKDTVEEKILQLQEQKRALVSQIISAEGGVFKSLTRDDVEVLFT
jgi:non-specific serine/threonine protein kinase